jgi:Na+-translocating ferredoxin:NAD+ oxidoreductase RNF subunit RnfB
MDDVYRELQKHLDNMPVGYPATTTGVELRLLKQLFTPDQARIALALDYKFRTVEQIHERIRELEISVQDLEARLEEMADSGNTFAKKKDGVNVYANMPLAIGMYELQVNRLTPEFLKDSAEYLQGKFAEAYRSTKVPQSRVIPVRKSITAGHRIGTYDELRDIIEKAEGRIRVGECLCRKTMQMAGHACKVTTRQETCMGFRDFGDLMGRAGWGRAITKEEALKIADKNEEDGLVLQPGNEQEVQFICSCCGDCCGALNGLKSLPRPAEFIASNYYAEVKPEICDGCGTCVGRCQMEAVAIQDDIARINQDRCIGCGLCVSKCPSESMHLVKKGEELVPPKDMEALLETIMAGRI